MADKENINNCTKLECNVLSSFLNPTKHTKSKTSHYEPIIQVCMKNRGGSAEFKDFQVLLESGSISTIVIGKLISKLKIK